MDFKEELLKLSNQILKRKEFISNEETTKQSLILPFLSILGIDIHNPQELNPEYYADFGVKKAERVDYAIFKNGTPILFLEAKSIKQKLGNFDGQLARYFNATPSVKFAILTNGIEYKFFTDFNETNIMDENPFLIVNMLNLADFEVEALSRFQIETFNINDLQAFSMTLIYGSTLSRKLTEMFEDPPDNFIRFLIKDCVKSRITQPVVERFRPLVRNTLDSAIVEYVRRYPEIDQIRSSSQPEPETLKDAKTPAREEILVEIQTPKPQDLSVYNYINASLESVARDTSALTYHSSPEAFIVCLNDPDYWIVKLVPGEKEQLTVILNLPFKKADKMIAEPLERCEYANNPDISLVKMTASDDFGMLKRAVITAYDRVKASV